MMRIFCLISLAAMCLCLLVSCSKPDNPTALVLLESRKVELPDQDMIDLGELAKSDQVLEAVAERCQPLFKEQTGAQVQSSCQTELQIRPSENHGVFSLSSSHENQVIGTATVTVWIEEIERALATQSDRSKNNTATELEELTAKQKAINERINLAGVQPAIAEQVISRAERELGKLTKYIAQIKSSNIDPATLDAGPIREVLRAASIVPGETPESVADHISVLNRTLANAINPSAINPQNNAANGAQKTFALKVRLEDLLENFSEDHPSVISLKQQIKVLEEANPQPEQTQPKPTVNHSVTNLLSQLESEAKQSRSVIDLAKVEVENVKQLRSLSETLAKRIEQHVNDLANTKFNKNVSSFSLNVLQLPHSQQATKDEINEYRRVQKQFADTLPDIQFRNGK